MVIVDASVAVKWVLDEEHSEAAIALARAETLAAPEFWLVEAANVLWKRCSRGELSQDEALEWLDALRSAPVTALASEPLLPAALRLAGELAHPVYDCLYIAAAMANDTLLVTADTRLFRAMSQRAPAPRRVRLLA